MSDQTPTFHEPAEVSDEQQRLEQESHDRAAQAEENEDTDKAADVDTPDPLEDRDDLNEG